MTDDWRKKTEACLALSWWSGDNSDFGVGVFPARLADLSPMPMPKKKRELDLGQLAGGRAPGISPAAGAFAAEAASVVLEHNQHKSGVRMVVAGSRRRTYNVIWPPLHPSAKRTHRDLPAAVEYGAYGIAFLLAGEFTEFKVIERSWKGTGIDYWLGSGDSNPFQQAARMEVSGIINNANELDARVKKKMKQTVRSAGKLPAYVAVVEFGQPKSVFKKIP